MRWVDVDWEQAEPGTEYVLTRYRDRNPNLRTQLERIIRKAGLNPWPRLFQNLRSTRETELAEGYPIHVVCAWIGNSRAVAAKHYLQVRDEDFARAATLVAGGAESGAQDGETAAQKQAQPASADSRQEPHETQKALSTQGLRQVPANNGQSWQGHELPWRGLEPPRSCLHMVLSHARLPIPPPGPAIVFVTKTGR